MLVLRRGLCAVGWAAAGGPADLYVRPDCAADLPVLREAYPGFAYFRYQPAQAAAAVEGTWGQIWNRAWGGAGLPPDRPPSGRAGGGGGRRGPPAHGGPTDLPGEGRARPLPQQGPQLATVTPGG